MPRFKTRTDEISAVQIAVENAAELKRILLNGEVSEGDIRPYEEHEFAAVVVTAQGVRAATPGMYLLRSIDGLRVMSAEAFEATYEPVEAPAVAADKKPA